MIFAPDEDGDRREYRQALRGFLTAKCPASEVLALIERADYHHAAVWDQMANQLGLQGLVLPAEYGGSGASWAELAVVFEELGAALVLEPFFATVALAAVALVESGDEAAMKEHLPGIADGTTVATLAFGDGPDPLRAAPDGDRWTLDGTDPMVLDGTLAGLVLVAAPGPGGPTLLAVDGDAPGLVRTALDSLDSTRRFAVVEFRSVPARPVGRVGGAGPVLERVRDLASVALAAEAVGMAERCLELSVEHAASRIQFGRPIGSFQAVKHLCANMLLDVELARSTAWHAAELAGGPGDDASLAASLARAFCADAAFRAAADCIQIHGGMGYAWEHPAHLYLKRAKVSQHLLGGIRPHRDRIGRMIGAA